MLRHEGDNRRQTDDALEVNLHNKAQLLNNGIHDAG